MFFDPRPEAADLAASDPIHTTSPYPLAAEYLARLGVALQSLDLRCLERMTAQIVACYQNGRTVFCVGNGGSASTASHIAADLVKLASTGPRRLRALCLNDSAAAVTAAANDLCYDEVFVEQLKAFLDPGDVVLGISTSGRSPNVIRAMQYAASRGATVLAITGARGARLREVSHDALTIASHSVQRIEDVTLVAGHLLCMMVRERCHQGTAAVRGSTAD